MKKKLTDNLGLKILAVLFSVIIWFIVININDPVDKTVFRNIPVEILNADVITSQGKVYEILDDSDMIDVTVWAKRSILDTLSRDNIVATADMQEVNLMDTMVRIKLATNKYNDRLESIKPSVENMRINIEDLKRVQLVVGTVTVGEPAEGYILGNVSVDQNLIRLSGPESLIDQVERAETAVDVSGLSQDIRTDASVRLYDAENNLIEDNNIKKSLEQVKVNVELLQTKRIPIITRSFGTPADGYKLTGEIECDPATVLVAGKGAAIKNFSQIEIPDTVLNVSGRTADLSVSVDLKSYMSDNISLADESFDGKAKVTVHIEQTEDREVELNYADVRLQGLPEDVTGNIEKGDERLKVVVNGLPESLDLVDAGDMYPYVDVGAYMKEHGLEALTDGEYMMPVVVTLPEDVILAGPARVRVVILEKNKEE